MPGDSKLSLPVIGSPPFRVDTAPTGFDPRAIEQAGLGIDDGQLFADFGVGRLVLGFDRSDVGHYASGVWAGIRQDLSAVSHHRDAGPGVRRFRFMAAPLYSAVHIIDDASAVRADYCEVHQHAAEGELNVLLPGDVGLEYSIYCEGRWWDVSAPAVVWAPPATPHCATAIRGSGVFFMLRVPLRPDAAA
jgi:hypothetical protein